MASGTPSELATSEMPVSETGGEVTPAPDPESVKVEMATFPPYPPYSVEQAPPSVADTIIAGRDLRIKHKSMPRKPLRPPPRPARPKGPKATDVKLSKRAMRAHARCLRKHGAILTDRLERMAKPLRRNIIYLWRDHAETLPPETITRLRSMLDADEPFKPDQAYEYFVNLKKTKKKVTTTEGVNEIKKDMLAMCGEKRFVWARNATVAFARGIQQRLSRPGRYALADGMLRLSNIILDEICGYMNTRTPSRRCTHPKAKFMMEMSDKVAVWIDEILSESDDRMLMMDFDEDEDVLNPDGTGDAGFADDFLDMMGAGALLKGPTAASSKFQGDMRDAFDLLTDIMDKKGDENLVTHEKFKQTYREGADALKEARDLRATDFNTNVANKIKKNLTEAVEGRMPPKTARAMKAMVDICSNYLAQNAEYNKQKGPAFKILTNAMRDKPNEKLYQKGKAKRTYGEAAKELESAKGLESNHDDPNLSQEIHAKMSKLVEDVTPNNLKKEMAEMIDDCSKLMSQNAVDENERGPAFDLLVKNLNAHGSEPFSEYPALRTKNAAAYTLSSAPGLTNVTPDPQTAPEFKKALHKAVDASTPTRMKQEMNEVIDRSGDYLSSFIRDRGPALDKLLEVMKSTPSKEYITRNDYTMDYKTAAEETENAPTLIPFFPVKDIADEGKEKLTKDMKDVTPPHLEVPMKTLIQDVSKYLSQPIAMRSGAAGERYSMNFLAAIDKSMGEKPLYKYKEYGQTYSDAADELQRAGPMESIADMSQSTQSLDGKSALNLRTQIDTEMKRGVPKQLAPSVAEGLYPTIGKAAKHLASIGSGKGKALGYLMDLMKSKGKTPLAQLQGYEQTHDDAARRIKASPTLTSEKVDKSAYETVKSKLTEMTDEKPDAKHAKHLPEMLDESSKFLSAPVPETGAEKRRVLADLMGREEDKIVGEDGIYKMTYTEGGEEITKAPVGVTTSHDKEKQKEMAKNIEAVIPDKKMKEILKDPVKEGAAHLTDVVKGRGEAMEVIHEGLKKEKEKKFIEVGEFKKTHENVADMLTEAPHFDGKEPSPVVMDKVEHQISLIEKDLPPDKKIAKEHMEDASKIASKYIANVATEESGLDAQALKTLDESGFNADSKAAAETKRVAAVKAGASKKVTDEDVAAAAATVAKTAKAARATTEAPTPTAGEGGAKGSAEPARVDVATAGPSAGKAGVDAATAGSGAEKTRADVATAGAVAGKAGADAATAGPGAGRAGADVATAGAVAGKAGADAATAGSGAGKTGVDVATAGAVAGKAGADAATAGPGAGKAGMDAATAGPGAGKAGAEVATAGPGAGKAGADVATAGAGAGTAGAKAAGQDATAAVGTSGAGAGTGGVGTSPGKDADGVAAGGTAKVASGGKGAGEAGAAEASADGGGGKKSGKGRERSGADVGPGGAGTGPGGAATGPSGVGTGPGGVGSGPGGAGVRTGTGYWPGEREYVPGRGMGPETEEQRRRRLAEAEVYRKYEEEERRRLGDKEYYRRQAEKWQREMEAGGPGAGKYRGGALGADYDPEHEAALDILHRELRARGTEVFYQQPQTSLSHKQASEWLASPYPMRVDKTVRESGDTARLHKKFERKLSALVAACTPAELYDSMQDVVIEGARRLSEFFVSTNYNALVREALVSEMQKRGNEILTEVDGAAETYFFAAQRIKKAKMLDAEEPCYQIAHQLTKRMEDMIRYRPLARKLTGTMKEHVKEAADFLSAKVTKPDDQIEAYIALLDEMEAAGDSLLIDGDIPKSHKEAAAYLRQLTSFEDQIKRPNKVLQANIQSKLRGLMSNVPPSGYTPAVMDAVIGDTTGLLVSYIMLQGEKTEALKAVVQEMDQAGDTVLLRHGHIRKSFKEGADLLRGKNTDQLGVPTADPVVSRKIQLKLNNLMQDSTPKQYEPLIDELIEDVTMFLAVQLLQPQLIKICKCMKNVFVQCELWSDEILRRVARPCCTCSRHVSAQALQDLAPAQHLRITPGSSRAFAPGLEISIVACPSNPLNQPRRGENLEPQRECPAPKPTPGCRHSPTTSYLLYSTTPNQIGYNPMEQVPSSSSDSPQSPFETQLSKRTSPLQSLLQDIHSDNIHFLQQRNIELQQSIETESQDVQQDMTPSFHTTQSHFFVETSPGTQNNFSYNQYPTTMYSSVEMPEKPVKITQAKTGYSSRTPIISSHEMADWHAMMVSLMWNVQAWQDWIQEIIDRALSYQHKPNVSQEETADNWSTFHRRVSTEGLQWRQYSMFSRQLTSRLALRYKDKEIVSPERANINTKTYLQCQEDMLKIIDMFNRWTKWLNIVVKETDTLQQVSGSEIPVHQMRWNQLKKKVEEYSKDWDKYNLHLKVSWTQKYSAIIADYLPSWKQPGPVWVVSACGAVPSGAVAAGIYDGEVIWVARTTHKSNVLPAALYPSKHCCMVYAEGAVHHYTKYQVMCNADVRWVAWRGGGGGGADGAVGARAVRVAAGVHVGRVHYRGDHLLGAVHEPQYRCHVVIFGRPFAFNCYELLMLAEQPEQ